MYSSLSDEALFSTRRRKNNDSNYNNADDVCSPGHLTAQYNVGVNYFAGKGVENDMKKAAYYFNLAAQQGHVFAQVYWYTNTPKELYQMNFSLDLGDVLSEGFDIGKLKLKKLRLAVEIIIQFFLTISMDF